MGSKGRIKGALPAVLTPFQSNGDIDEQALRRYLRFLVERVDGLFLCGSYGSGLLMAPDQRRQVAEIAVEEVAGAIPIILHVGFANTRTTIELARHGKMLGVDMLASVTPYYYRHSDKEIINHYKRLIDAVDCPWMLYNNPKYTQYNVSEAVLKNLADYGLKGLKDSGANIGLFYSYMHEVQQEDFTFLIGSQTLLVPAIVGGADGCVSGLSNAFPDFVKQIYQLSVEGCFDEAVKLQKKANVLRKITGDGIPIPFYHSVMRRLGMDIGVPQAPFVSLDAEAEQGIFAALDTMGMLVTYD